MCQYVCSQVVFGLLMCLHRTNRCSHGLVDALYVSVCVLTGCVWFAYVSSSHGQVFAWASGYVRQGCDMERYVAVRRVSRAVSGMYVCGMYVYVCVCVCMCVCMCVHMWQYGAFPERFWVCMYVCVCVCVTHVYIYIYTYVYMRTFT